VSVAIVVGKSFRVFLDIREGWGWALRYWL